MKAKLQQLQQTLAQGFVGRDEIFKSALLGLIAGENILLIGPPGTAKSMLARRISQVLHHDDTPDYFEYLLTKFSTPEEIFGPLSIHELKQDRFQRNITGYLPSVQIGFLDEIFKASSSILNALLTILNERKYHNGTQSLDVPLQSLVAASNELPIGQEELSALYDRFLIRRFVDYVGQNQLDELFDLTPSKQIESSQRLSIADLQQFRKQAEHVVFPAEVKQAILQIKQQFNEVFKENRDEQWSDRRFIKCLHLMRISAITNQRTEVDFSDILLLKDCIWNNPAHQEQVLELIKTELRKYDVLMPINTKNNQSQQNQQKKEKQKNTNKTVSQNVIKGYKGAGTKHDPILIENLNQFIGLQRAEIGQQGYYFKQTADIDCTGSHPWPSIDFKGHYHGGGHQIIHDKTGIYLFNSITESTVEYLQVQGFILTKTSTNSEIKCCQSSCGFAYDASDSTISNCVTLSSGHFVNQSNYKTGIVLYCRGESLIENCFVTTGNNQCKISYWKLSGISQFASDETIIQNCAIGKISVDQYRRDSDSARISQGGQRFNNISLASSHFGYDSSNASTANGENGQSIPDNLFNQYFFEHNLGWDFEHIWQWNDTDNCPELQPYRGHATPHSTDEPVAGQQSRLQHQMQNNIWL